MVSKNHDPTIDLHEFTGNLYKDAGAVAITVIYVRYKQTQDGI